jgi:hypothetical protein
MPIQPIECWCQSSADGHRSISVPIHWPDWVPIDLSVHRPKRSHHIVPSSALGVFRRVHRFAWTSLCTTKQEASAFRSVPTRSSLRVDIALHQGPCLKFDVAICTRTSENQDLSQSNSWAVRQRVGVRIRWCHLTDGKEEAQRDRSPGASLCPSTSMFCNPLQTHASHIMQRRPKETLAKCCVE